MIMPHHELIPLASPERWNDVLSSVPHSFSHTWGHCQSMYLSTGYLTYLYSFRHGDKLVLCPICERSFEGFIDIVTPYGFNGFISNRDCPVFNSYWKDFCRRKGYVCGYIGCNPLVHYDLGFASDEVKISNDIYTLDLAKGTEKLVDRLSENRKRQFKKLDKDRSHVSFDKERLSVFFLHNYKNFIEDKAASGTYYFSQTSLEMLVNLDSVIMTGFVENDKVEAVSLFGYTPSAADFLFNISTAKGKGNSFALMWLAIEKLSSMNIPVLNLGGGVKEGDSLSIFKKRFGAEVRKLESVQQVYDQPVFNQLCIQSGVNISQAAYFPPYRAVKKGD